MKEKPRELLIDLALGILIPALVGFLALWKIFQTPGFILVQDLPFTYDIPASISQQLHAWNHYASSPTGIPFYIFSLQLMIHYWLGLPADLLEKLWLLENYVLAGVFMYFAMRMLLPESDNKLAYYGSCTAASLFFMINKVAVTSITVVGRMLAYASIPIITALYVKTLRDDSNVLRNSLLVALAMNLLFGYTPLLFAMAVFMIFYQFFRIIMGRVHLLPDLKKNILIITSFSILNAYRIFPLLIGNVGGALNLPSPSIPNIEELRGYLGSAGSEMINIVTLNVQWFSLPETKITLLMGFLIPLIAFSSVLLYARQKNEGRYLVIFHALLAAVCIVFATRTPPFDSFWFSFVQFFELKGSSWLLFYRSPSAFVLATAYFLSFLSAMAIYKTLIWTNEKLSHLKEVIGGKFLHSTEKALTFLRIITVIVIIGIVIAALTPWIVYSSYPLSGNINNHLIPVDIPREYKEVNTWLQAQTGLYRAWWLPQSIDVLQHYSWSPQEPFGAFPDIVSSKPYLNLPVYFYKQGLLEDESSHIGKLLSIAGVKYAILHADKWKSQWPIYLRFPNNTEQQEALSALNRQKDLKMIYNNGFIYAFENEEDISFIHATPRIATVVGGLNTFASLIELDSFNPKQYAIIFSEQLSSSSVSRLLEISDTVFFSNCKGLEDLYLPLSEGKFVYPTDFTTHAKPDEYWSGYTGQNLLSFDIAPLQEGDFIYGGTFATTHAVGGSLDMKVNIESLGPNEIWIRAMRSPTSGKISVYVDGAYVNTTDTASQRSYLKWIKVGEASLTLGAHTIRLVNENGGNLVNVLFLVPPSKLHSSYENILNKLQKKNVIIIKTGPTQIVPEIDQYSYPSMLDPRRVRGSGAWVTAQSFTPRYSNISGIDVDIARVGRAENLVVELKPVDANGFPTSEVLASAVVLPDEVSDFTPLVKRIPLECDKLDVGKKYCIVFIQQRGSPETGYDLFGTHSTEEPDAYENGSMVQSVQGGLPNTWWDNPGFDIWFRTYYAAKKVTYDHVKGGHYQVLMCLWNITSGKQQEISELPSDVTAQVKVLDYATPFPGEYTVTIDADKPFFLTIPENYDSLWHVVGIEGAEHFPVYSFLNGFYINKTGKLELTIEYAANNYFEAGVWVSALFLTGIIIFLVYKPALSAISAIRVRLHRQQKSKKIMFN